MMMKKRSSGTNIRSRRRVLAEQKQQLQTCVNNVKRNGPAEPYLVLETQSSQYQPNQEDAAALVETDPDLETNAAAAVEASSSSAPYSFDHGVMLDIQAIIIVMVVVVVVVVTKRFKTAGGRKNDIFIGIMKTFVYIFASDYPRRRRKYRSE